ncbi:MAG: hypothetical protein HY678_06585 [Chloroflexi bacterium]|nr:hypothetical protein [Chloroflexota bacterium]
MHSRLLGSIAVRLIIGLGFGAAGAVIGYFLSWGLLTPQASLNAGIAVFSTGIGIGAGLGSFLGWLDLDRSKLANLPALLLALAGGLLGAWGGLGYAASVYDVDIKTQDARITAVAGAAFAANLVPALWRLSSGLFGRSR